MFQSIGIIPTGIPNDELEEITVDYEKITINVNDNFEYFGLELHDDNMLFDYKKMDHIIFAKRSDFKSGQDCIVLIDGSAVFKKLLIQDNGYLMQSLNSSDESIFYTNADIKHKHITIYGIAHKLIRNMDSTI